MGNNPLVRRRRRQKLLKRSHPCIISPGEKACRCGGPVHPVYFDRCEDCWVNDQIRWDGHSRKVKVL